MVARVIRNNSLQNNDIFCAEKILDGFDKKDELIKQFNLKTLRDMNIEKFGEHYYIRGYCDSTKEIVSQIQKKAVSGVPGYEGTAKAFLKNQPTNRVDDPEKVKTIENLFANQNVGLIYGPAGTGKSTLISMICEMLPSVEKIIACNTKTSLDHLKRICRETPHNHFYTIAQLKKGAAKTCKLFIVDECSTVENIAMLIVLRKITCDNYLFAGDTNQLESIGFGNWFAFSKMLFPSNVVHELTNKYRTNEPGLRELWDSVRSCSKDIGPILQRNHYSKNLSGDVFHHYSDNDEITLCLNYDGIYGINNLNAYLQEANANPPIEWQHRIYKKGDPILFIDNDRFGDLLYNNLKGKILSISKEDDGIVFEIEAHTGINAMEIDDGMGLELIQSDGEKSTIKFRIGAWSENNENSLVPFQVAYAASINKAQGLEYESVKIIIDSNTEEKVDKNTFYTAITRSKKHLHIFWSPESEHSVIDSLKTDDHREDLAVYKALTSNS